MGEKLQSNSKIFKKCFYLVIVYGPLVISLGYKYLVKVNGMTNLIFGIGIGLFLILILWALALFVFIITLRVEKKIGAIAILIVSVCTIILIVLPRASVKPVSIEKKIYDHLFIWRILLLVLLVLSSIVGLVGYIKFELIESIRPIRISNWIS